MELFDERLILWQTKLDDYVCGIGWTQESSFISVATASGYLFSLDNINGDVTNKIKVHNEILAMSPSPRFPQTATAGADGYVKCFDTRRGDLLFEQKLGNGWVEKLVWSPDGNYLAIGYGKIFILLYQNGKIHYKSDSLVSTISGLCWKNDSSILAIAYYGGVLLYSVLENTIQEIPFSNALVSLSWSKDGKFICGGTQDHRIHFWELPLTDESDFEMSGYPTKVNILDWDFQSKFFASNCYNDIIVWQIEGDRPVGKVPLTLSGHLGKVTSMAFQHNSFVLASGEENGIIWFWNPNRKKEAYCGALIEGAISQIKWSPNDNQLVVGTASGLVSLLDSPI